MRVRRLTNPSLLQQYPAQAQQRFHGAHIGLHHGEPPPPLVQQLVHHLQTLLVAVGCTFHPETDSNF